MLNWLKRERALRRAQQAQSAVTTLVNGREDASTTTEEFTSTDPNLDVDAPFFDTLLDFRSVAEQDPSALERAVCNELDRILTSSDSRSNLVPRVPAVIPQLMRSLRDDRAGGAEIAEQITRDPTLVAEVIRLANSPYYRTRQRIKDIKHCVFMLGRGGLRELVANVAMKPLFNLKDGHFSTRAGPRIWKHAEQCAVAAGRLARAGHVDPFEAYLGGLMLHIGMLVVVRVLDDLLGPGKPARSSEFRDALVARSTALSTIIALEWGFPEAVVSALEQLSVSADQKARGSLAHAISAADKLAKMRTLVVEGRIDGEDRRLPAGIPERLTEGYRRCYEELFEVDDRI